MMTRRRYSGPGLILATHNPNKLRELRSWLPDWLTDISSSGEWGLPVPDETGQSCAQNAAIKARATAMATGRVALADDAGFFVAALGGQPGHLMADWARREDGSTDYQQSFDRIQAGIGDSSDRSARFVCCLALGWPDGHVELFEGYKDGVVLPQPCGDNGFAYDTIFRPLDDTRSYAQMSLEEKNQISHRGHAFSLLLAEGLEAPKTL
ncbi:MAG: non-canonical purine NTP pyrophosphatase [Alphaproteobacteria bacterium]|nr:MAG: non-canonical purine NTP pyrophosphatase [Alphaproteobacteria bacterium]